MTQQAMLAEKKAKEEIWRSTTLPGLVGITSLPTERFAFCTQNPNLPGVEVLCVENRKGEKIPVLFQVPLAI